MFNKKTPRTIFRTVRIYKNMTPEEFAKAANLPVKTINDLENLKRVATQEELKAYSKVSGIRVDDFIPFNHISERTWLDNVSLFFLTLAAKAPRKHH